MDSKVTYLQMLPEELILLICRYLEIEDKILIVKEYKMLNYILANKSTVRKLEFGGKYHLSKVFLKSAFKMEIIWDLVEELNLTSCYCLARQDIFAVVKKTKRLKALYLADTKMFSLDQLKCMLSPLSQLTRLSLTYNSLYQEAELESLRECLKRLEFCFLFFPTNGQRALDKFLSLMTELRELWCVFRFCVHYFAPGRMYKADFPTNVEKLVLSESTCRYCYYTFQINTELYLQNVEKLENRLALVDHNNRVNSSLTVEFGRYVPTPVDRIETLGVYDGPVSLRLNSCPETCGLNVDEPWIFGLPLLPMCTPPVLDNLRYPKLKRLSYNSSNRNDPISSICFVGENLREMRIDSCCSNLPGFPDVLVNLHRLSVVSCILSHDRLAAYQETPRESRPGRQLPRSSHNKDLGTFEGFLKTLVTRCPDLYELELRHCLNTGCSSLPTSDKNLACLSDLKKLERLTLNMINILDGKFLTQITTQCIKLSSLRLGNLGLNGRCSYIRNLCSALGNCNNLKDFRLDQSNIGRFDYLLDALSSCPKLQRVYLSITKNTDKLMEETVMTFLERTNKLLFFGVRLPKTLFNSQLQSRVNNWVRKSLDESRPTPVVVFVPIYPPSHPDSKDYLADVPAVHLMEMVKNLSRVCLPFSQKGRYFNS